MPIQFSYVDSLLPKNSTYLNHYPDCIIIVELSMNSDETKENIWTEDDFRTQITLLENNISLLFRFSKKVPDDDLQKLADSYNELYKCFKSKNYDAVEKNLIYLKKELCKIHNKLGFRDNVKYFILSHGLWPIIYAIITMLVSFSVMPNDFTIHGTATILGIPIWASFLAVIGASVQILIGAVNDYKDGYVLTVYKGSWYAVLPFVSFALGFIAFVFMRAQLTSLGPVNQNAHNSTVLPNGTFVLPNGIIESSHGHQAFFIIICFLAGYSSNWFIGLLQKYTSET